MAEKQYKVIREHGAFLEGDTRTANEADVKHLIGTSLEEIGGASEVKEKAKRAPRNKKEPAVQNKAEEPAPPSDDQTDEDGTDGDETSDDDDTGDAGDE